MSLLALIAPLLVNVFFNILTANVPNNTGRKPPFCYFSLFLIVSLIPFINNPDSSSDWTILIIYSITSFEVINVVVPDP